MFSVDFLRSITLGVFGPLDGAEVVLAVGRPASGGTRSGFTQVIVCWKTAFRTRIPLEELAPRLLASEEAP